MCAFKIVFSNPGQLISCGSASSTALISSLNFVFVYMIEVQSCAVRVQSEETWCDSISRLQCGLSYVCALFSDDGEKKDINGFSNVLCWAPTLCSNLASREGFVRLLSECVSARVISLAVS